MRSSKKLKIMCLPLTTGRIAIEEAFRADELGSSTIPPLLIEESLVYLDLFSLEDGLPLGRDCLAVFFLGAIA